MKIKRRNHLARNMEWLQRRFLIIAFQHTLTVCAASHATYALLNYTLLI